MDLQSFNSVFPYEDSIGYIHFEVPEDNCDVALDLVDFYCTDPDCNCHKLTLKLMDQDQRVYATFSYGWKRPSFYSELGINPESIKLLTTGFLDSRDEQSQYASILLEPLLGLTKQPFFRSLISKRYSQLKKHVRAMASRSHRSGTA